MNPTGNYYNYEEDLSITIKNDYIIREYIISECPIFNFYKSDIEEDYKVYGSKDGSMYLKEYNDYCTFEITSYNGLKI